MNSRLLERCRSICGGISEKCIIYNRQQLECIADMVINKSFAISLLLRDFKEMNVPDTGYHEIEEAIVISNELSNWVKYLQITSDLKTMQTLLPTQEIEEKRKEIRFPLPSIYQKYLLLEVDISGTLRPVTVTNFSQSGMQIESYEPLEKEELYGYLFKTLHAIKKEVYFKARTKYCEKKHETYVIGAQIERVFDNQTFNFFNDIYDFIIEVQKI